MHYIFMPYIIYHFSVHGTVVNERSLIDTYSVQRSVRILVKVFQKDNERLLVVGESIYFLHTDRNISNCIYR